MKPRDVKSEKDLLTLSRDNFPSTQNKWTILVSEGEISLHPPREHGGAFFRIPRKQFNAIVDWYCAEQERP